MSRIRKKTGKKSFDCHHLFWPRADYGKGYAKGLRTYWYLKVEIPKQTLHAQIHHEMGRVPTPSEKAAKGAYEQLVMLESYGALHKRDHIEKRLELVASLFDYSAQDTADALRQQAQIAHRFYNRPP